MHDRAAADALLDCRQPAIAEANNLSLDQLLLLPALDWSPASATRRLSSRQLGLIVMPVSPFLTLFCSFLRYLLEWIYYLQKQIK